MAESKTRTAILAGVTMTAGSGNVSTVGPDLTSGCGASLSIKITNGSTGPTVAAQAQVQVANNYNAGSPTLWVNYGGPLVATLGNNVVTSWTVELYEGWAAVQIVSGSNTVQNCTIDADISVVTARA